MTVGSGPQLGGQSFTQSATRSRAGVNVERQFPNKRAPTHPPWFVYIFQLVWSQLQHQLIFSDQLLQRTEQPVNPATIQHSDSEQAAW